MPELPLVCSRRGFAGGPALVFLHGFLGTKEDWNPLTDLLVEQFDIVTIDLPGHGESVDAPPDLFRFDSCSRAIAEILDHLNIASYFLVGYSMGGRIALVHTIEHPQQVRGLALISAQAGLDSQSARLSRLAQDQQLVDSLTKSGIDAFVKNWYAQPLFSSLRNSARFEEIVSRRTQGNPAALALALSGFSVGRQNSMWARLCELNLPVLCVVGDLDPKYADIMTRTADLCPQGKASIIEGAGHAVHLEKPDRLAVALQSFVCAHR
jgi:2-succinyl-6-hydroxy-2,4-cyclohexadiene-1-carboxylate synthase